MILWLVTIDPCDRPTTAEILASSLLYCVDEDVASLKRKLEEKEKIIVEQQRMIEQLQHQLENKPSS